MFEFALSQSPSHIFPPHLPSSITSFFPTIPQVRSVITHYFTHICDSTARDIYLGILYGYKMVLQIIALVLAFATRKVKVKGLDDAKYIAAAIYVTSIVLAVIIISTYTLKGVVNGFAAVFCTGFLIGTTSILVLVFVPKVRGASWLYNNNYNNSIESNEQIKRHTCQI